MDNHYHLLIETPDANISQGMRQLNGLYTQKFNEIHQRVGHLFQGRFHAVLIEDTFYLLTVARYIVLNPVRAGIVQNVKEYRWSSYLGTAGILPKKSFLTIGNILLHFSSKKILAQERYCAFIEKGTLEPSPFLEMRYGILGSDQFMYEMSRERKNAQEIIEIPREQRIIARPLLEDLFAGSRSKIERNHAIYFAVFSCGYSLVDVARHLSLHYSGVGRIFQRECESRRESVEIKT